MPSPNRRSIFGKRIAQKVNAYQGWFAPKGGGDYLSLNGQTGHWDFNGNAVETPETLTFDLTQVSAEWVSFPEGGGSPKREQVPANPEQPIYAGGALFGALPPGEGWKPRVYIGTSYKGSDCRLSLSTPTSMVAWARAVQGASFFGIGQYVELRPVVSLAVSPQGMRVHQLGFEPVGVHQTLPSGPTVAALPAPATPVASAVPAVPAVPADNRTPVPASVYAEMCKAIGPDMARMQFRVDVGPEPASAPKPATIPAPAPKPPTPKPATIPEGADPEAPWGRKADGTPKKRPGRPPKDGAATPTAAATPKDGAATPTAAATPQVGIPAAVYASLQKSGADVSGYYPE